MVTPGYHSSACAECWEPRAEGSASLSTQQAARSTGVVVLVRAVAVTLMLVGGAAPTASQELPGGASAMAGVPVAARDLPRGATLTAEDVVGGAVGGGEKGPAGWVTRRVIAAGEALREPAIMRPNLVAAGEVVQLVWRHGSIELRLVGRAMGSAAQGERVQVRVDSRRRFAGVVIDRGLVRIQAGKSKP